MVPVFNGRRFLRSEPMQFVEPSQIEQALENFRLAAAISAVSRYKD